MAERGVEVPVRDRQEQLWSLPQGQELQRHLGQRQQGGQGQDVAPRAQRRDLLCRL